MADALRSGRSPCTRVKVQVLSSAPLSLPIDVFLPVSVPFVRRRIKSGISFSGRLISSAGENTVMIPGFQGSDYDSLLAVATIWLRNEDPKDPSEGIVRVGILDLLRIVFLHPSQDLQGQRAGAQELLSLLFVSQEPYETKRQVLKERYGILMTEGFEKEMRNMCTFSEGLWNRALNTGMERGMEQGILQGREEGMEQGIGKGAEDAFKKALSSLLKHQPDLNLEKAMDMLDIPAENRKRFLLDPDFQKFH